MARQEALGVEDSSSMRMITSMQWSIARRETSLLAQPVRVLAAPERTRLEAVVKAPRKGVCYDFVSLA